MLKLLKHTGLYTAILAIMISGCSGSYGNIRNQTSSENEITLSFLKENFDDYNVYYGKRSIRWADAIMFDPKDSGTSLSGDSWNKIEDKDTLDEKVKEIKLLYHNPRIYLIEGVDKRFFGYIYYSGNFQIALKIVDDRTIYALPPREYKSWP